MRADLTALLRRMDVQLAEFTKLEAEATTTSAKKDMALALVILTSVCVALAETIKEVR